VIKKGTRDKRGEKLKGERINYDLGRMNMKMVWKSFDSIKWHSSYGMYAGTILEY
jgi:hypothetical protein